MSTDYKIEDQAALYYLTLQVVDWVDIFTRQIYRDIVIDSIKYCQQRARRRQPTEGSSPKANPQTQPICETLQAIRRRKTTTQ
jgi:hypothetical protein